MGTRKISQLDTISDANLSGEAILPVVVSDPLIPNRKAKVNQLFRGVAQGTKSAPGLCFDLDRNTGLYQNAYDQLGVSFGNSAFYYTSIANSGTSKSLYITAVDESVSNVDIVMSPKGTGAVKVTGNFVISDEAFILEDAQGPKARFEVSNVGTGTSTRIFTFPAITQGNGTTVVGDDTTQTLRNKTILIDEDNFVITDGDEEAIFQINWTTTQDTRRSYFLPDAGTVTTTAEPTATASTLLDTKTEQTVLSKTFVNVKLAADSESATNWAQFNTDALDANRIITVPNQSFTLVGEDSTQTLSNKSVQNLLFVDDTDPTKKVQLRVDNQLTTATEIVKFPDASTLNSGGTSTIVTASAEQTLLNKSMVAPTLVKADASAGQVTFQIDNITASRVIKFPDSDATLLSTDNVTLEDVQFGAGISAEHLTGRLRLQQFFYAGF